MATAWRRRSCASGSLERAEFGDDRFDKVFGVHVAALWHSEEALAVVREHLDPGGALYVFNQAPGWSRADDAREFGEEVAGSLRERGFHVEEPLVGDLQSVPVLCVVARPSADPRRRAPVASRRPSTGSR